MTTTGAARAATVRSRSTVLSLNTLAGAGVSWKTVHAQCAARRWQRLGTAVVLHNGELRRRERWEVARLAVSPSALLTAFTAAEFLGLTGWERDTVHVLGGPGAKQHTTLPFPVRLHRTGNWAAVRTDWRGPVHRSADALAIAASSLTKPEHGYGLLAAAVQQRMVRPDELAEAVHRARRTKHRALFLLAIADITGGAQALSEIDFARLCRRAGLPEPSRQSVRREPDGRRRFLDVEWVLPDGRRVVVEIDGSFHTSVQRWADDQIRQNYVTLARSTVLRFPAITVRTQPDLVVAQLRLALR